MTAALLLVAGCGDGKKVSRVSDPRSAVLSAGDLPRGYRSGDDTVCGIAADTEGNQARLDTLFRAEQPKACIIELERVWASGGGPAVVTSAAFLFGDAEGAQRGFDVRADILEYTASVQTHETGDARLGDEAKLVHGRGLNHPATAIVWRSTNVTAVLAVEPADDKAALRLAALQQERIEGKAPRARPVDPVVLELNDPSLTLPVYWLGRSFHPSGSLPQLDLQEAAVLGTGPGNTVKLDYSGSLNGRAVALTLDLWKPAMWRRFRGTLLGRLVWDSACARRTIVPLSNGRAEIFEGYGTPRPLTPPCPTRPPDRVLAHVYLDGVVVVVDMPYCYMCAAAPALRNPYEAVEGMTAIARSLRLRGR
jgi:hypothetical protein